MKKYITTKNIIIAILAVCALVAAIVIWALSVGAQNSVLTEENLPTSLEMSVAKTPEPLSLVYEDQPGYALPSGTLEYGFDYDLPGIIVSNYPITQVAAVVYDEQGQTVVEEYMDFARSEEILEYELLQESRRRQEDSLDDVCDLTYLTEGAYEVNIMAKTTVSEEAQLMAQSNFVIEKTQYVTLSTDLFSDSYHIALEFFGGDEEKFMFDYIPPTTERNIKTDPAWFSEYIVRLPDFMDAPLYVHVDARQNFEDAIYFMENTHIRVTSTNANLPQMDEENAEPVVIDTGVILLQDLVQTYNGGYVSRFTSSLALVSHHAFGTAIDLNAAILPNTYELSNRPILQDDVENHLEYNGIKEENGVQYYDFTYTGDWEEYYNGVPGTCLNYLLYELAFYPAGFGWGFYYESVCDAMHYTLTEKDIELHDEGLRKIYDYVEE